MGCGASKNTGAQDTGANGPNGAKVVRRARIPPPPPRPASLPRAPGNTEDGAGALHHDDSKRFSTASSWSVTSEVMGEMPLSPKPHRKALPRPSVARHEEAADHLFSETKTSGFIGVSAYGDFTVATAPDSSQELSQLSNTAAPATPLSPPDGDAVPRHDATGQWIDKHMFQAKLDLPEV